MNKLIALIMATIICLSVAACGGTPAASSTASTAVSDAAPASGSEPAPESTPAPTAEAVTYPLTYTPKFAREDVPTEGGGGIEGITLGYGGVVYDETKPTTLEYPAISNQLLAMYKGEETPWPEYDDQWKDWGYDSIENTDTASIRVMTLGRFDNRHAEVLMEYGAYLSGLGVDTVRSDWAEAPLMNVPYSLLESKASMTAVQLAEAAYYALFMQTWSLVPADKQGVMINTPDGSYTAEMILEMATEG